MEANLQLILLGVGVLVIAGILLDGWRRKYLTSKSHENRFQPVKRTPRHRNEFSEVVLTESPIEPLIDEAEIVTSVDDSIEEALDLEETNNKVVSEFIVINVFAKGGETFEGLPLLETFDTLHLYYGEKQIFHYYEKPSGTGRVLFSVASAFEPGYFNVDLAHTCTTKGVLLFMKSYNNQDALTNFEIMLRVARQLATQLDGELRDESREILTIQSIEHIRNRLRKNSMRVSRPLHRYQG